MSNLHLRQWASRKEDRLANQRGVLSTLQNVEESISSAQIGRFFGSTYLRIKWLILMLAGFSSVIIGLGLITAPELAKELGNVYTSVSDEIRIDLEAVQKTVSYEAILELPPDVKDQYSVQFIQNMNAALDPIVEEQTLYVFQNLGMLLLIFGIISLYLARLTRKMRIRNRTITEAENAFEEMILHLKASADQENQELKVLKAIIDGYPPIPGTPKT
jgi:hypothetical protein